LLKLTKFNFLNEWKVSPMIPRSVIKKNTITDGAGHLAANASANQLVFPVLQNAEQMLVSTTKSIYGNGHTFQINSISLSPDGDSFLVCFFFSTCL
jgi:WD40 repeat protein